MAKRDIFDLTFDALQRSLTVDGRNDNDPNSVQNTLQGIALSQVSNKLSIKVSEVQRKRRVLIDKYHTAVKEKLNAIAQTEGSHRLNAAICKQYEHAMERRLVCQRSSSERRMKDLVFEVVGEYGKSHIRIARRQEYLRKTGRTKIALSVWNMNWQKFALRLKFELCQSLVADQRVPDMSAMTMAHNIVQCEHLNCEADKAEMESVVKKIAKKSGLITDKRLVVQSVVRITKNGKDKGLIPSSFKVATNLKELQEIMALLRAWAKRSAPPAQITNQPGNPATMGRNLSSRGGRSAGGGRPRQLPAAVVPLQGPLLKELLSTASVAWLHSASFSPTQWDQLYLDQYNNAESFQTTAAGNDPFSNFVRKYHAQHTCTLFSERAYFCLEERSLAGCCDHGATGARAVSPDSALLAVLGDIGEASREEKRVALENAITMQLLATMQEIYVDHPFVNVTHAHDSLRTDSASQSLFTLRELLLQPLTIVGFSDKHRRTASKPNPSKTTQIVFKYLPSCPDVMVVRTVNGALLHFAPAMLVHLPETQAFAAGGLSSEQMRLAGLKCPHPQLASLSLASSYYLTSLYCPVLSRPVDAQNILRDGQQASSGHSMLSLSTSGPLTGGSMGNRTSAQGNLDTKNGAKLPFSTAAMPTSPLYMMPLTVDGIMELFQRYLLPPPGTPTGINIDHVLTLGAENAIAAAEALKDANASALGAWSVLPDHARYRVTSPLAQSSPISSEHRKLRCIYVLLPDDKVAENTAAVSEVSTPRKSSNSNISESPKPPKALIPACYYLVQVYEPVDKSVHVGTSTTDGTQFSELDDAAEINATTFALTQHDSLMNSSPRGEALFGLTKAYDLEDDFLRSIVLDEYKTQLSVDVSIAPAVRSKDPKQGSRQQASSGKVNPAGVFSSLGALSGSPRHSGGQVLEEDQDEGDTEAGDSLHSGQAGNKTPVGADTTKRRWDPNVLSTVCRWRSCMCESALLRVGKTSNFKQKQLCSYHLEMKNFLDSRGGKQSSLESSKYLPRKAPNFSAAAMQEKKRDMMTIRAASTLLQELWDGKLRATVRSFTKKVVRDMAPRVFLEASNTTFLIAHPHYMLYLVGSVENSGGSRNTANPFSIRSYLASRPASIENAANSVVPAQPTWAIWKNRAYLDRTTEGQDLSLSILDAILLTEKTILRELEALAELRAYPSAELVLIRKEVKAFKDHQDFILLKSGENKKGDGEGILQGDGGSAASGDGSGPVGANGALLGEEVMMLSSGYDDLVQILSAENKLCERKLLMMGSRRQEEEERRVLHMKKLARAKAQEDNQTRDPASFRNQRF